MLCFFVARGGLAAHSLFKF